MLLKQLFDLHFAAFLHFVNVQFLQAPDQWYYHYWHMTRFRRQLNNGSVALLLIPRAV